MQFEIFSLKFFILFSSDIVIAEFVIRFIEFLKYFTIECNLSTKCVEVCAAAVVRLFCFYFDLAIDIWFTEMHSHNTAKT